MSEKCDIPPAGWHCTREKGHEGPCAAIPGMHEEDLQRRIDELILPGKAVDHPMFLSEIEAQEKVIALQDELAQALITIKELRAQLAEETARRPNDK